MVIVRQLINARCFTIGLCAVGVVSAVLGCAAGNQKKTVPPARAPAKSSSPGSTPSQGLSITVPRGWHIGHQQSAGDAGIIQFVPDGETVEAWTRMITVQTTIGLVKTSGVTPKTFLATMGQGMRERCPESFVVQDLGAWRPEVTGAHTAIMGCGNVQQDMKSGIKKGQGEIAVFVAFHSAGDLFLVHRALRSAAFDQQRPPLTADNVSAFMKEIQPIKLCRTPRLTAPATDVQCIVIEAP